MNSLLMFFLAFCMLGLLFVKNKILGTLIFIIGCILSLAEYVSLKTLGGHIDYLTLSRIDADMLLMAYTANPKMCLRIGVIIVLIVILEWFYVKGYIWLAFEKIQKLAHKFYEKLVTRYGYSRLIILLGSVLLLWISSTTLVYKDTLKSFYNYTRYTFYSTETITKKIGMTEALMEYDNVNAQKGKNLVLIYCESLEKGFLNKDVFPYVSPQLNNLLSSGWSGFVDYKAGYGASWTIGALYATQTSLPTLFGDSSGNKIFNRNVNTKVVSFGKILKKAGYHNEMIASCRLDFGGTGKMMSMLGYDVYEDWNKTKPKTSWGVHDKELFAKAKKDYVDLNSKNKPFNLTMLTIDTHFNNGIPDPDMKEFVNTNLNSNSHEFAVASLDYLLGDFVDFIKRQPNSENTVIVIIGDHLMMGDENNTKIVGKLKKNDRRVLFMTNVAVEKDKLNKTIEYYNVPGIILDLMGVKHNYQFLDELIPNINDKYVRDRQELFTVLNLRLAK